MDIKSFISGYNAGASKSGGSVSQAELEAAIRNVVPEWALEENPPEVDADPAGTAQTLVNDLARKTAQDLANYYDKSQTLTKDEINTLVSAIPKFKIEVVTALPTSNISDTTVYLVKSGDDDTNLYTEYIRAGGKWEKLGTQTVDLTGYATEAWVNDILAAYVNTVDMEAYVTEVLNGYLTKEDAGKTYQAAGDYLTTTTGDQRYAKPSDIPTVPQTLPNPCALSLLGKTYNGSSPVALTVEEIIEAIKTASGGVIAWIGDDNSIYLAGNLLDGTYKAYFEVDGEYIEIGELTLAEEEPTDPEPAKPTNFFKSTPVVTDKVYGADDVILAGGRVNDSGEYRNDGGKDCLLTNYIPVKAGDEIEMTNLSFYTTLNSAMYKSDKTIIGGFKPDSTGYVNDVTASGTVQRFKIAHADAGYVRICGTPDSGILKDSTAGLKVHERYDLTQVIVNVKRGGEYL